MITLYKLSSNKAMMQWSIDSINDVIFITYGQVGGSLQTQQETVKGGLAGRTLETQVQSRITSRVNKQLDKGYRSTQAEASILSNHNALNLYKPMLAQRAKDSSIIDPREFWVQYKYDGHRCLITKQDGEIKAYSRQGKWITSIHHILEDLDIPEGCTIDGELYHHGTSLQTIASWVKREQANTALLKLICYDVVINLPYKERHNFLSHDIEHNENIIIAPTGKIRDSINETFLRAHSAGYEGLILRRKEGCYEAGKRSHNLLKIKAVDQTAGYEKEFQVVNIHASKDGWAILECTLPEGGTFRTSAPGTMQRKTEILNSSEDYIGQTVTVEFPNYTDDGKPFHAVATRWREDI